MTPNSSFLYKDSCVTKVCFSIVYPSACNTDAPVKECAKVLSRITLILHPVPPDEALQVSEEFFDRIQIWRVGRQEHKLDACVKAQVLDSLTVVERGVVHDKHRFRFWPTSAMLEKLFDEVFEDGAVR
jgi:hypothetical protein